LRPFLKKQSSATQLHLVETIRGWLGTCTSYHRLCQAPLTASKLPTRVLDLRRFRSGREVRLVTSDGCEGSFVALSYLWGSSKPFRTTQANLKQHMRNVPLHELPQTYLDAVMLVANIGVDYLWIDALCIVQDDRDDWELEIANMAAVYEGALFVLIVAWAAHPGTGFLRPRLIQSYGWSEPIELGSERVGYQHVRARLRMRHLKDDPCEDQLVNLRGWT